MNDRVTEYARAVVLTGRYPDTGQLCGRLHILACKRHLADLERQRTEPFPYYWDPAEADRVLQYSESLTLNEGFDRKQLKLMDCQAFDIGCVFGWRKTSNGFRRFRRRYKSISRQQGKSLENGLIGTYIAGFSGYHNGKLFTAATKKKQSRIAWEEMQKFISADDDMQELFDVKDYKSLIVAKNTGCTIEALSKEGGLDEGFRSIYSSIDEIHQHRDNKIYKNLYNGTRSLPETLVSMITTRGDRMNSFCFEMDSYCVKILEGLTTAEDFFVDIYCMDPGDDIFSEENWPKSCPFTCRDPERMEILRQDAKTARDMGGMELRDFIIKSLNMWAKNADLTFVNPDSFANCGENLTIEDVTAAGNKDAFIGIDLSSGGDLTTISGEIPLTDGRIYIFSHSFMPRGRYAEHIESDIAPYDIWADSGLLTLTGGETEYMTDYKFIVSYLSDLRDRYGLRFLAIGIDPHNAAGVLQDLEQFDCDVINVTQSARNLNDATVEMKLLVKSGGIVYDRSNELLAWSFVNAATVKNSFGETKIDKNPGQEHKRIDPVDAVIDAHFVKMLNKTEAKTDINENVQNYLTALNAFLKR